jgi:hypothetical protein
MTIEEEMALLAPVEQGLASALQQYFKVLCQIRDNDLTDKLHKKFSDPRVRATMKALLNGE